MPENYQTMFINIADKYITINQPLEKKASVKFSIAGTSWSKLK